MENESRKISFPSKTESIAQVDKLVDTICEQHSISEDHYGNILVALTEAVNNAIQHGNQLNPEKDVEITYTTEQDKLTFFVRDFGTGFDFENLPDPTDPANLEKPNGRGIFLMRNLADEVEFTEDGRVVELNFNTSTTAPAE